VALQTPFDIKKKPLKNRSTKIWRFEAIVSQSAIFSQVECQALVL